MLRPSAPLLRILLAPILGCGAGEDLIAPTAGALEVITATVNPPSDLEVYTVAVDGTPYSIGLTDTLELPGLGLANHEVGLVGVPQHCTIEGTNPRFLSPAPNETIRLVFEILCDVQGIPTDVAISIVTAGSAPDPDGYSLQLDEQSGLPVGVNQELTLTALTPGIHHLRLSGIASNCEVRGANPRMLDVPSTIETAFEVTCLPPLTGEIIYASLRGDTDSDLNHDIFLRDVKSTSLRNLTDTPFENEVQPVWSPDGLQIASPLSIQIGEVVVMNADGLGRRVLPGVTAIEGKVQWNSGGDRLLYKGRARGVGEQLAIFSLGTDEVLILAQQPSIGFIDGFCWSPDGTRVAYGIDDGRSEPSTSTVYTISASGGVPAALSATTGARRTVHSWSPDGGAIAFVQEASDGRGDIYLVPADGSGQPTNLTNRPGAYREVTWSPDSQSLAFNNRGLFSVTRTGALRQLTAEDASDISWFKDGSRLVFTEHFEIHVINFDGTGRRAITADGTLNSGGSWRP